MGKGLKEVIDSPGSGLVFPDMRNFTVRSSPITHAGRLTHPVFLFQSLDDSRVAATETRDFANKLKAQGTPVSHQEVRTGGHYDSMIEEGIPAAIRWIKEH